MSKILTTKNNKILIDTNKKIYTIEKNGATIKSGGGGGTNIVGGQYVEKVYFNTDLSIEEVYAVCDTLDFLYLEGFYAYTLYYDENITLTIFDFRSFDPTEEGLPADTDMGILIIAIRDGAYSTIFNTSVVSEFIFGIDFFDGWVLDSIDINSTCLDEENLNPNDTSQLVSTTPFTKEEIELSGEYDGSTIEVTDLSGDWQGTLYKTNEYVEKLYFNTSLSVEEVDNYLSQLEYSDGMYNLFVDDIQVIGIMDASAMGINGYIIMSNYNDGSNLTLIYCSNSTLAQQMGENFEGWNTTFEGVLELNSTSYEVSPNNDLPVNPSNITSDLVSTTPFTKSEENTINIKKYINEKKIPLSIKVNVDSGGGGGNTLKTLLDATKSASRLFYNYLGESVEGLISYSDTENVTSVEYMFYNCPNLTTVPQLDTSNVTKMNYFYQKCILLETLPQLDTSKVTAMNGICDGCTSLKSVQISIRTDKEVKISEAFQNCTALTSVKLIGCHALYMPSAFRGCLNIKKIDIGRFFMGQSTYNGYAFMDCYSLKALILRKVDSSKYTLNGNAFNNCYHILGKVNSTYNPEGLKDGYIYVPRDMIETLSSATNWSTHADQLRALEDYTLDGTTTGEFDDAKAGLV